MIVSFRVPPVQFSNGEEGTLPWHVLLEKRVKGGGWAKVSEASGEFSSDLEVQRMTVPRSRMIRLTVSHQGEPVVMELPTHEVAMPGHVNGWISRVGASEPCPWMIHHARVYQNGLLVDHPAGGYYVQNSENLSQWLSVSGDGTLSQGAIISRVNGVTELEVGGVVLFSIARGSLVGSYPFEADGSRYLMLLSRVVAPASML